MAKDFNEYLWNANRKYISLRADCLTKCLVSCIDYVRLLYINSETHINNYTFSFFYTNNLSFQINNFFFAYHKFNSYIHEFAFQLNNVSIFSQNSTFHLSIISLINKIKICQCKYINRIIKKNKNQNWRKMQWIAPRKNKCSYTIICAEELGQIYSTIYVISISHYQMWCIDNYVCVYTHIPHHSPAERDIRFLRLNDCAKTSFRDRSDRSDKSTATAAFFAKIF